MSTTTLQVVLFTFLFSTFMFLNLLSPTLQDNPCAYPCYPPPTGSVTTAGGSGISEPPPSQPGLYSYPTTPTGDLPYNPSPSYGNNNYLYGPPPPDPILPYFPYYFKKPPHMTDEAESSSAAAAAARTVGLFSFLMLFLLVILRVVGY